jgi:hypothetical protein
MLVHDRFAMVANGGPIVFARLGMISCSVCALNTLDKESVEAFANRALGRPIGGWVAVDKSRAGMGDPTPNPCNHEPDRQHWFLVDGLNAAQLFGAVKD